MHVSQRHCCRAGCKFRNNTGAAVLTDEGGTINLVNATIIDNGSGMYAQFGGQLQARGLDMARNAQMTDFEGNTSRLFTNAPAGTVGSAPQIRPLSAAPEEAFLQPDDEAFVRLQEVCCFVSAVHYS